MVRDAEATARSAEGSTTYTPPGMCLQWSRTRADIPSLFPDAATAWRNAFHRHKGDRNPPRGAMVYWLGGSKGYGHIAVSVGGGKVRSTDVPTGGKIGTVPVGWFEQHWGLPYAGWADNVNDVRIPGVGDEMTEDDWARMEALMQRVWSDKMTVTQPGTGQDTQKARQQVLRELWQKVTRAT
jgi:hypothetical protein